MFIFLERDNFEANSYRTGLYTLGAQSVDADSAPIRRPYRGIQIKNDTYAVLSVRKPDGSVIPLASSSSRGLRMGMGEVDEYSDFILQRVDDQRMEKQQIIETFGDTFVYFFGERPRMITISGQLINTEDVNWRAQFWHNYENYFRGSKLVQLNARVYLAYDTMVLEGYPISAVAIDESDNPYQVSFQMTIMLTDYHEYSVIGETRFKVPPESSSLEVLNQELEERRKGFVSTTAEVRRLNLEKAWEGGSGQSAMATLRAGLTSWNSATTWLGNKLQDANNLMGGRAMRIPIGAASYLQLTQEAEISSASITTSSSVSFDAKTGKLYGDITVNGTTIRGNKLLIMGPAKFAPMWKSDVLNTPGRGFIHENYDEYPLIQDAQLKNLVGHSQYDALARKEAERVSKMTAYQESLILYSTVAEYGGTLSSIAAVVSTFRESYGMLLTAASTIRDPLGTIAATLGVTPQDVTQIGEGLKDGAYVPGVSKFVGGAARKTWENWIGDLSSRPEEEQGVTVGEAYEASEYKSKSAADPDSKDFDAAYGDSNYEPLLQKTVLEGTQADKDALVKTLDEAYGNADAGFSESSEDPAALNEVYGQEGTIEKTTPTGEERAQMIQEAYNGDAPPNDTDTSGITAADADSAPIDPVL